ncbi:MAG: DMT family transporter [Alphaproteobacteria bacterium]|nr:DMT family transporter [Alphaproteobacteria bacterium]
MLSSVAVFSVMDALVKWLAADYSVAQLMFFRSVFAFVPLGVLAWHSGGPAALRTTRPGGHVLRALIGITAMGLFFLALGLMPLADVVAISFAGPLFLTALSVPLLGERVGIRRWAAVVVGFLGVLVIVRPGPGMFDPVSLVAVGGAVAYGLAMIMVRKLSATESTVAIVFYFTLSCALVSGLALPFTWVTPPAEDWIALAALGVLGGLGQILMTNAFRRVQAAVVAPLEYTAILFAVALGIVFWNERPDSWTLIGAAVVIACGLYILHRETMRGRGARARLPTA